LRQASVQMSSNRTRSEPWRLQSRPAGKGQPLRKPV